MEKTRCFKFVDADLNEDLLQLLQEAKIPYLVDKDGAILYSADDEETVENDLIPAIRDTIFPSWQVLTCPPDWIASYREYIAAHGVPIREELSNGECWFLIPRKYRPSAWKLKRPTEEQRLAI
jgi:hypothetical protein